VSAAPAAPPVSVVIATRDRPQLLRNAIAAALAQDYDADVEVLAVFDQSEPDRTLEKLSDRAGRRVRVLRNTRTPGLAGARNSGAEAATGDLLAFCDDDDEWLPGKLRAQVARLRETAADTVVGGVIVDYEGKLTERVPSQDDLAVETLLRRRVFAAHPSTVMVRRSAFLGPIGEVDEQIPGSYGEDYDWLLRAAQHGPVAVVSRPLARVLWHRASFFARRWETIISALDYLLAKHPGFAAQPAGLARIYGQKAFAYGGLGHRRDAAVWALRALRLSPREKRAYLALLVGAGLLRADVALRLANATGRGI
jgi:glycosyltransferase involved in cell wall biosynthesis